MEIRKIKESEQEQAIFILSQAFYYDCEGEYRLLEKGKFRYMDFTAAFDDEGTMAAVAQCIPQFTWLDGTSVKSAGMANVAALPEARRKGYVRRLMKLNCDAMYDSGCVLSYLYPFSYPYYRKFGYEFCCELLRMEAAPDELMKIPFNGSAKQFEPGKKGTDPGEAINIYNEFARKYNIMLDRDAWQWERKLEHDPVKSKIRTYIVYNADGNACAYFTYEYGRKEYPVEISIKDLAWSDYESMYLLFAFLGRFAGNVKKIKFHIPPEMEVSFLWKDHTSYEIFYEHSGMARIINAKKALELLEKPSSDGSFTIKIDDPFMEQNNKSYKVVWKNGKSETEEYEGVCDLECSVMALAQILTGFVGLAQAAARDDVKINSNSEILNSVFKKKAVYIADFF